MAYFVILVKYVLSIQGGFMSKNISKYCENLYLDEKDVNKIISIMNDYDFLDLLSAVYCINICINNRSSQMSQMKLNLSLNLCDKKGKKEIKQYSEFEDFFNKIHPFIKTDVLDDPILEDFSEIVFKFHDEIYNTVIGTGYSASYALLYFLEPLSLLIQKTDEFARVIKYNSNIIRYFKDYNISDNKDGIRLVCPPNILYKRVKEYFSKIDFQITSNIFSVLKNDNEYIEKQHFILYNNQYYPLYNLSILIDLFDLYFSKLSDDMKNEVVNNGIYFLMNSLASIDAIDNPMVLYPVKLFEDLHEKNSIPFTFLARTTNNNVIIAINKSQYCNEQLEAIIAKIEKKLKENNLKFIELRRRNPKAAVGLTVSNKISLKYILYDNYVNVTKPFNLLTEGQRDNILECTALDLVYMLLFSSGFDEIESYIEYNGQNEYEQIICYGGDSCRFFTWKSMDHMIAKGAIKFGMISTDINVTDNFVLNYYKKELKYFPWKASNNYLFATPFSWNIMEYSDNIYIFKNKVLPTFFGYVKYFDNNQLIFFAQNLLFWTKENIQDYTRITSIVNDIVLRKLKTCFKYFQKISLSSKKSLLFLLTPVEYANEIGIDTSDYNKIVFCDCIEDDMSLNVRYAINDKLLYEEIGKANNRCVENRFIKELFTPIKKYYQIEIDELNAYLDNTSSQKKEVEAIRIGLDYIYNNSFRDYLVKDYDYLEVKKLIAKVCLKNEIEPGEYFGKEATSKIRKIQEELIKKFENLISDYNKNDLHIKLLEMYNNTIHDIYIHKKRYSLINNVTNTVLNDVRDNIINLREEAKENSRTLLYLIESNLYVDRENSKKIDDSALRILLAFSRWLVNLNDTADICYFTDNEAHIIVNYEYVVDNKFDNESINAKEYIKRVYAKNTYMVSHGAQDEEYIEKILKTFEQETGCDLVEIFDICHYLQMEFLKSDYKKLDNNVYKISKESVINNIHNIVNNKYSKMQIEKNLDFLIINSKDLKTRNGQKVSFLPFNERKNRDNRFEIKPVVLDSDYIIFAPALMKNVHSLWFDGLMDFMLPYEKGIPKTRKMVLEWKKIYEDKMVTDIKEIFIKNNISFVKENVKIHKINKSENFPIDIGDFDVIAIDDVNKKLWIIESKFLSLTGSLFETFEQQRNFFKEGKYIEKFQRRIDFINSNYKKVLESYGVYDANNYEVLCYMVFNKVMVSRYRDINIPLISIMELEDEIKKTKKIY